MMDYEFRNNETGTDSAERKYAKWLSAVSVLLNREIEGGCDTENEVSDYYFADMTPAEAAAECLAQEKLAMTPQTEKTLTVINRHGIESQIPRSK